MRFASLSWLWKYRNWVALIVAIILLAIGAYFLWEHIHPIKPVAYESQQQAETPQGVQQAADSAQIPITKRQAAEIGQYIRENAKAAPMAKEATTGARLEQQAANALKFNHADYAILTDPVKPDQKAVVKPGDSVTVNEYLIKAYPGHLLQAGLGKDAALLSWSVRTNVPKIPLIIPHGAVGYVGVSEFLWKENGKYRHKEMLLLTIPTD
jgi:hypothetical protein